jgi:endonuclease/exonuclease/phosphatase family metal-dependent hydrolase
MIILSWNILASEYIEKQYYKNINNTILFNNRSNKIYDILLLVNADVILLQEVMPEEYRKILKIFSDYHISPLNSLTWYGIKGESGNVSLFKKSMFKRVKHNLLDFGIYSKCIYKNKLIHIINLHLDDESKRKRYEQINSLHPIILKEKICIIGGDFNHSYKKNSRLYKIDKFMVHNFCISYMDNKRMNVDNILTKGFIDNIDNCENYHGSLKNEIKYYGSDHLPIFTNVKIKK